MVSLGVLANLSKALELVLHSRFNYEHKTNKNTLPSPKTTEQNPKTSLNLSKSSSSPSVWAMTFGFTYQVLHYNPKQ